MNYTILTVFEKVNSMGNSAKMNRFYVLGDQEFQVLLFFKY